MTAREEVLARVRRALVGVGPRADIPPAPQSAPPIAPEDLVDRFAERVADYRATVERCAATDVALRVAEAIPDGARVILPYGLGIDVAGATVDDGISPVELDSFDAVVTGARVGIAETGTIVLDHGTGQGRRAISLIPDIHVCVVRDDQIVTDVLDAMNLLDPARPLTWISGPSATSDIELDRVEGVHGPRTLHVLLVET
ncbi:lactate utilization protein C [Nocardioides sp.]|uniref:lactate utilization protein C n=1 Tax=Nocardioides sp. TaxID=35761 RepID=UPI003784B941